LFIDVQHVVPVLDGIHLLEEDYVIVALAGACHTRQLFWMNPHCIGFAHAGIS
jgi:hypothetical protein